ncbi:MAG: hypothetical protein IKV35_02180, partial [Clostridia bacterium]|nr:hypothetical protein [Clostridia bacterium]
FTSEATSGDTVTTPDENAAYGEKDPAVGMSYYENYSNLPELSADAVKATVVRARYTNDGSMTVALMFSNGASVDRTVTAVTVTLRNVDTGRVIASKRVDLTSDPCTVKAGAFEERQVMIDQTSVPMKYDKLDRVAATVEIG